MEKNVLSIYVNSSAIFQVFQSQLSLIQPVSYMKARFPGTTGKHILHAKLHIVTRLSYNILLITAAYLCIPLITLVYL